MGENIDAFNNPNSEYITALKRFIEIFGERLFRPWTHFRIFYQFSHYKKDSDRCLKILHNFTNQVIAKRKKARLSEKENSNSTNSQDNCNQKERKAFLDTILDAIDNGQGFLNDEELRQEVDTFMFEGHDTTANGLVWAIYYLGKHEEVQKKVHDELDMVFGDDTERAVTTQDLTQLKYLEASIKEALRLMTSVPMYGRTLTEDLKIGEHNIPAGVTVSILANYIHRDPRMFPDPEKYIPERHLDDLGGQRHPFSFVAFSAGPRNCIGQKFAMMEEKIVLANLFRNFYVECKDDIDDMDIGFVVVNRPLDGVHVVLKSRCK
ncbi:Cytochrome P450 4V2, variant 2 [Chamberlinius hualienensis]